MKHLLRLFLMPRIDAQSIVGCWRTPETDGIEISHYFYPDGVYISQNPRRREFVTRGLWAIEEEQLVFYGLTSLHSTLPPDRERRVPPVIEVSSEQMVWGESGKTLTFRKIDKPLPDRKANPYWEEP
jgi:hypothetical protein